MKQKDKKVILIWILALVAVILTVVLAVILFQQNREREVSGSLASNQQTEEVQQTDAQKDEGEQPEETDSSKEAVTTEVPKESSEPKETKAPEKTSEPKATAIPEATNAPVPTKYPGKPSSGTLSALHLDGTQLCDEAGNPVQLRGISTHGIGWFPQFVNEECFKQLHEEWNVNVVRLAMYTAENNGYCTDGDKESLKQLVKDGVTYATNQGLYVIIDWHILSDNNPNTYKEESKAFFKEMSAAYKDYTNVIYEICNEPNGGTSWKEIKTYAEEVIGVIRENDEDAIIIVGTPNWSQYVDQAAADPITTSGNIMYALHFYAATHKEDLRKQMVNAVNNGLPVFVTEYGICDASGNGGIDEGQANAWVKAMDEHGISYVAWNLSNKNETSAIISSNSNKVSGFGKDDLSASGKWVYEMLTGKSVSDFVPSNTENTGSTGSQAGNQSGSSTSGGQQSENQPAPTNPPAANVSTGEGLVLQAEVKDSWAADGGKNYNYGLNITNNSGQAITGWNVTLKFSGALTSVQGWGGTYTIEGNLLHISNESYNGKIGAGESIGDVGFIVAGGENLYIIEE